MHLVALDSCIKTRPYDCTINVWWRSRKALRSGTENLPAIASMAKALRLTLENEEKKVAQQKLLKKKSIIIFLKDLK